VVVLLRAGGLTSGTYVDLTGDDQLTATSGALSTILSKRSLGVLHSYAGSLEVDAENTPIEVAFTRTLDSGAPSSTLAIPKPFTITTFGEGLSSSQNLSFSWDPSGTADEMEFVVEGECILAFSKELDGDPGSAAIEHGDITPVGDEPGTSCQVTTTLRRVSGGTLDPAFEEGGVVQGIQSRKFTATYSR
jgi:hypothetical protein